MSAFGTKKPLSDVEQQLSFPTVFQQAYAAHGEPLAYEDRGVRTGRGLPYDKNLQGAYHEQKRREAHEMVRNAVRDTRAAKTRALVSHAGYWMMPAPVLTQRVFANPSLGSGQADIYPARRTAPGSGAPFNCVSGGGLSGGVLRSKEGQEFGKKILMNRIAQLNAIDAAAQGLETGAPISTVSDPDFAVSQGLAEQPGAGALIKLTSLVSILINNLLGGVAKIGRFGLLDFTEMLLLLFRVAPVANREELEDLMEAFDEAAEYAADIAQELDEIGNEDALEADMDAADGTIDGRSEGTQIAAINFAQTLVNKIPDVREYVKQMLGAVNKSPKDRLALSKALVKSLGFSRYNKSVQKIRAEEANEAADAAVAQRRGGPGGGGGGPAGGDEDDDMGDDFDLPPNAREDDIFSSEYSQSTDERQRIERANRMIAERERAAPRAEAGAAMGYRGRDPRRYLDEPGPQRFAAQGSLGYFGEAGSAPQPALINPFRAPGMIAPEAATAAAYRPAPLPILPGFAPRAEAAIERAQLPAGMALPAAAAALPPASALTRQASAATAESEPVVVPRRRGTRPTTPPRPTGKGKVSDAIVKDAAKAIKKMVSTKGTKKSAAVAPAPAPAPPKPKGKGKATEKWMSEVVSSMKGAPAPAAKKGRPAKGPHLLNGSGKRHKGPYHQMPDGTYMTGKTHSARSRPLTVA